MSTPPYSLGAGDARLAVAFPQCFCSLYVLVIKIPPVKNGVASGTEAARNGLEHPYLARYVSCMNRRMLLPSLVVAAGLVAVTDIASAKDTASGAVQHTLPGVDGDYHIVRPMPEPENADPLAKSQFKVGDMDVRIGGSITVDIGAGNLRQPR